MEGKPEIREEALARREGIPVSERERKSALICEKLLAELHLLAGKAVTVYAAMGSEVSLDPFIRAAFLRGARLCFPCMTRVREPRPDGSRETFMAFREVSRKHYEAGGIPFAERPLRSYPIDDPALGTFPLVTPNDIDAVIVPVVAFDPHFNRLGYGGGNYDRFLPQLRPDTLVIGVAFTEQRIPHVPTEEHDRNLPHIISA